MNDVNHSKTLAQSFVNRFEVRSDAREKKLSLKNAFDLKNVKGALKSAYESAMVCESFS